MDRFRMRKGKGERYNYIEISKNNRNKKEISFY